jgi:hypothetical protein
VSFTAPRYLEKQEFGIARSSVSTTQQIITPLAQPTAMPINVYRNARISIVELINGNIMELREYCPFQFFVISGCDGNNKKMVKPPVDGHFFNV